MKTLVSALVALSVLTAIAAPVSAQTNPKDLFSQVERYSF